MWIIDIPFELIAQYYISYPYIELYYLYKFSIHLFVYLELVNLLLEVTNYLLLKSGW